MPYNEQGKFCQEFDGITTVPQRGAERVQEICENMVGWNKGSFPGSQPVSLDRQNIELLSQRPYRLTWKADGTRWVFLNQNFFKCSEKIFHLFDKSKIQLCPKISSIRLWTPRSTVGWDGLKQEIHLAGKRKGGQIGQNRAGKSAAKMKLIGIRLIPPVAILWMLEEGPENCAARTGWGFSPMRRCSGNRLKPLFGACSIPTPQPTVRRALKFSFIFKMLLYYPSFFFSIPLPWKTCKKSCLLFTSPQVHDVNPERERSIFYRSWELHLHHGQISISPAQESGRTYIRHVGGWWARQW